MDFMKYLTIVVDDRVGLIADISYILSKAKINIETISVEVVGGKAIVTLGIKDIKRARDVFKNSGYTFTEQNALVIKLIDRPGELSNITALLKEKKVQVKNIHMLSKGVKYTVLVVIVDKPKAAREVLGEYLVSKDES